MLVSEDQPYRDGTRSPTLRDVRDLCVLYKVSEAEQERLMTIARESKQQGWWNKFDDLAIEPLIGLEIEAKRINSYESSIVPWAFQTESMPVLCSEAWRPEWTIEF